MPISTRKMSRPGSDGSLAFVIASLNSLDVIFLFGDDCFSCRPCGIYVDSFCWSRPIARNANAGVFSQCKIGIPLVAGTLWWWFVPGRVGRTPNTKAESSQPTKRHRTRRSFTSRLSGHRLCTAWMNMIWPVNRLRPPGIPQLGVLPDERLTRRNRNRGLERSLIGWELMNRAETFFAAMIWGGRVQPLGGTGRCRGDLCVDRDCGRFRGRLLPRVVRSDHFPLD